MLLWEIYIYILLAKRLITNDHIKNEAVEAIRVAHSRQSFRGQVRSLDYARALLRRDENNGALHKDAATMNSSS